MLVVAAAVGTIGYRSTANRLNAEVDNALISASTTLGGIDDRGGSRFLNRGLLGVYWVKVIDRDGDLIASNFDVEVDAVDDAAKSALGNQRAQEWSTVDIDGKRLRLLTVGTEFGGVQIGRSLDETDRVLDDVRSSTVVLVVAVSALAALLGWWLAGSVVGPLRRLTDAASEVESTGNLDVALPAQGSDEVGRLGSAFGSMLAALDRSRAEQQRLVQDAGHELRTPLTSLRTNLAVLRRHPDLDADVQAEILGDLDNEVTELTALVNEVVAVASGDATDQAPELVDLGAVAADAAQRVERHRNREVVIDIDDAGSIEAVPARIDRAIFNLIDNAAKFDPTNGPIQVDVVGGKVTVLDRGPGLAADDLPLIFERFHRSEAARTLPGSGLGLSIVSDVAAGAGGTVHASNRPDGGAAIGFEIPVVADP